VLDRFDFIFRMRMRGIPAILGIVFLGTLVVSLLLFLVAGNRMTRRVLSFPGVDGRRMVAEERLVPRHRTLEANITELAEGVLLGPSGANAARLFPRGARVVSALVSGRTLFLDLSPLVLLGDLEVPLKSEAALAALDRTLRFNFPRLREVDFYIGGQKPAFPEKKKI
jgi:hypothetical protein